MPKELNRVFNFSPGPAALPTSVLEQVRDELLDYKGHGMSLIEMSHRGKIFDDIYKKSIEYLRQIAFIPDRFDILYMTGGASTQFVLVPLNLSKRGNRAGYIHTGSWSKKAIEQAKIQGIDVQIAGSSEDTNFTYIPKEINFNDPIDYLHITSNNTIFGTQYSILPKPKNTKLIIDMSSDFLSRPIQWDNIGMVYAGAQKNAGPAGLTIVIIDRDYYELEKQDTPTLFRYSTFGKNESMYNTPPTFQIYIFFLILKWIEEKGGLEGIALRNQKKAQLIYNVIDSYPYFYRGYAKKEDRSLMNITWNFSDSSLDDLFIKKAEKEGMFGLKGHRSVGGLRASIYNSMEKEGCQLLANSMKNFCEEHGG